MNTPQALVTPLLAPYATAATILATAIRNTWQVLRSDRAINVYRTLSILLQIAGWLAFLACLYALQAGKAARRFYEAEWAAEAYALALRIDNAIAPLDGGATLPQADERHQDSPSNPAPDRVVAFSDHAIAIHPDQVQTVLNSTGTATNKLRTLANLVNLQWRHSRGKGKHMSNSDIRSALASVLPADLLAQLS
ncbi:hypothetical protein [Phormidium tenue]|uniref:Uncharacterized protein n=1 Tax=Phormidium tenue NIES-30 TaxID=549789 RepID=A0A1U7J2B3_9CYAN|nr:hypothetical protein [Phormidium tenue]MBD2233794.1 hypothetical protein [Phormidium tenue FACHB-1052]OKH46204.1 hypothetical protein NIES30_18100 [Phormidium tenue NIES-30]